MQPDGIRKGMSGKSLLYDSLKVYLSNKNRLQPIIGLNSVAECVMAGSQSKEALYLCEVCVCRLRKPDIRNHIMGSLHRYNYIKAWHPHFVAEWNESTDLSKLAWPLMEMAQLLEQREGPGDVQVLEVNATVYKKLESHHETKAIALLNTIRWERAQRETGSQTEATSGQLDRSIVQSNRVVLQAQNELSQSKKPQDQAPTNITQLPKATAQATQRLTVSQLVASSVRVEVQPQIVTVQPQLKTCQKSHEPSVQSEDSHSVFDDYTGSLPLIGLDCVVECRSEEEGRTYCFLCHCCKTKSTIYDVIDHITSSSHFFNYIMEIYPEQVDVLLAGVKGNRELLQSIAEKVEQQKGRGRLKVMKLPASLCNLLTGNSYHWCKKMLSDGNSNWASTNTQKRKHFAKGPSVVGTAGDGMTEKHAIQLSKLEKQGKKKKRKIENVTHPVFKVSLPLSDGATLLERTSFSLDKSLASPTPSPAASPACSPELDCGELAVSEDEDIRPIQSAVLSGVMQRRVEVCQQGQRTNVTVVQHPEEEVRLTDGRCFNWMEDLGGTNEFEWRLSHDQQKHDPFGHEQQDVWGSNDVDYENQYVHRERNESNLIYIQGGLTADNMYNDPTGVMGEHPNVPQNQEWAIHNAYRRGEQGYSEVEQQVNADYPYEGGPEERNSRASSQVYSHQLYITKPYSSLQAHTSGQRGIQMNTLPSPALHDFARPEIFHPVQDSNPGPCYNGWLEPQTKLGCLPPDSHAPVLGSQSCTFVPSVVYVAQGYVNQPYLYSSSDGSGFSGQIMPGGADGPSSTDMVNYTSHRFPAPNWEPIPYQNNATDVCVLGRLESNHNQICHQFS